MKEKVQDKKTYSRCGDQKLEESSEPAKAKAEPLKKVTIETVTKNFGSLNVDTLAWRRTMFQEQVKEVEKEMPEWARFLESLDSKQNFNN